MGKNNNARGRNVHSISKKKSGNERNNFLPKNVPADLKAGIPFRPVPATRRTEKPKDEANVPLVQDFSKETHLFVSEGKKTEPGYLDSMVDFIVKHYGEPMRGRFDVQGAGGDPSYVLKEAKRLAAQFPESELLHVWVIYDKDDFPPDTFDNVRSACCDLTKNQQNRIFHALWSNECFEVWLLFHFKTLPSGNCRSEYINELSEAMTKAMGKETEYRKESPPGFEELLPWLCDAKRNAKNRMEKGFPEGVPPSRKGRCTRFYKFIEYLMKRLPYIKEAAKAAREARLITPR